ncbi:Oleosin [Arabidopsis suecica]|uniref:Glycine-rich protein GRP20 n=3 Tax=Arabidopsis TaxID=3701 RepID=Q94FQ2_ARATH|nr:glycine-rich protein GRP20 [Arabidopsis thaliana]KAG7608456.1 Oleosin [Arabidopsis suecica]CAA0401280.1 unnamed protein product [Arabidopsis thaliana]
MAPFPLSLIFGKKKRRRDDEIRRQKPTLKGVMTAFFATEAAICLLLLAGISLTGTAVALFASMPLFLVFSPVLVPAGIATTILASGLMAGGTSGVSGLTILMWLYKKYTGRDFPIKIPGAAAAGGAAPAAPAAPAPAAPAAKPAAKPGA